MRTSPPAELFSANPPGPADRNYESNYGLAKVNFTLSATNGASLGIEMTEMDAIMRTAPVIPVLVLDDPKQAVAIGHALVRGGLTVLEVTLRTPRALEVMAAMIAIEGAIVGAGTVLDEAQLDQALEAGARFIVSPGLTSRLAKAAAARRACFLPGVANASDIMRGLDLGLNRFKFFPAEASGGLKALKALAGPFGDIRFCPTGGITPETAPAYLAEDAVLCVGGSWLVKPGMSLHEIEATARDASGLGKQKQP